MAALFDVILGATEAINQKAAQAMLGCCHVATLVHGAEDVVAGNLPVKRGDETGETVFADCAKHFVFFHQNDASK